MVRARGRVARMSQKGLNLLLQAPEGTTRFSFGRGLNQIMTLTSWLNVVTGSQVFPTWGPQRQGV